MSELSDYLIEEDYRLTDDKILSQLENLANQYNI